MGSKAEEEARLHALRQRAEAAGLRLTKTEESLLERISWHGATQFSTERGERGARLLRAAQRLETHGVIRLESTPGYYWKGIGLFGRGGQERVYTTDYTCRMPESETGK
jgi:hypothetical protein